MLNMENYRKLVNYFEIFCVIELQISKNRFKKVKFSKFLNKLNIFLNYINLLRKKIFVTSQKLQN